MEWLSRGLGSFSVIFSWSVSAFLLIVDNGTLSFVLLYYEAYLADSTS